MSQIKGLGGMSMLSSNSLSARASSCSLMCYLLFSPTFATAVPADRHTLIGRHLDRAIAVRLAYLVVAANHATGDGCWLITAWIVTYPLLHCVPPLLCQTLGELLQTGRTHPMMPGDPNLPPVYSLVSHTSSRSCCGSSHEAGEHNSSNVGPSDQGRISRHM